MVTSHYALAEAERHLEPHQRERLAELLTKVQLVTAPPAQSLPPGIELRAKDSPILAAALAARATHLVTGDRRDFGAHFGRKVGGLLIVPPRAYLDAKRRPRRR